MPKSRRRHAAAGRRSRPVWPLRVIPLPVLPPAPAKGSPGIAAAVEADRRFFQRFPARRHRIRIAAGAEIEAMHVAGGRLADPPEGMRWFTVVARVPGGRMRRWCQLPADMDQDAPEAVCADLFRALCGERGTVTESCVAFFEVPRA